MDVKEANIKKPTLLFAYLNLAVPYIANIAFVLGVLCFIFPFFIRLSTDFEFALLILTYCLLLLNAVISVKVRCAGKWAVTKGILAFICCALTTPYLKWLVGLVSLIYEPPLVLLNSIGIVLHSITLAVVVLPALGLVRKRRAKRAMEMETGSELHRPAKKQKRRIFKLAIASIIVALVVVISGGQIIPLLTADPVISVDYLSQYNQVSKPAGYDPNENAAPYYEKAIETYKEMPEVIEYSHWKTWPGDMNDADLDTLRSWLASNSEALGYLKKAASKPYYWVELHSRDNSLAKVVDFTHLSKFRQLTYSLRFRSRFLAGQGQVKEALESAIELHNMGAHLAGPRTLVEQLAGMAIRRVALEVTFSILDRREIDSATLTDFQRQLDQQVHRLPRGFVCDAEKLATYDTIQQAFADDGTGDGRLIPGKYLDYFTLPELKPRFYLGAIWISLYNPGKRETTELTKKLYELLDELAQKTPWQLHQENTTHEEQVQKLTVGNHFVSYIGRSIDRLCILSQEENCYTKALIATVALLRYKADKGQFPENLDRLISNGYLNELPVDPYSSGSLVYKHIDDNFILYSVGADFDDDGGVRGKSRRWGRGKEGGDQVFWPVQQTSR